MSDPTSLIQGDVKMKELLQQVPAAKRALFAAYHIGGCSSCAYGDEESLAEVCQRNELDLNEVLDTLRRAEELERAMLVSPQVAQSWLQEGVAFYDLRTREEFEAVSIPSSHFLDLDLQQNLFANADPQQRIVLVDHLGNDALNRCAWFRGHGLQQAYALEGGIDRWSQEVDPTLRRYRLEIG